MRRDAIGGAIVAAFVAAAVAAGAATDVRYAPAPLPPRPAAGASESAPPAAPGTPVVLHVPPTVS